MQRVVLILISIGVLVDMGYSFLQHYHNVLDGDMPGIILPAEWYSEVLDDPFAIGVLLDGKEYAAPNRFFCHWSMSKYFKSMPILLQNVVDPINSVYLSCAIIKTGVQFFLIWIIASVASGVKNIFKRDFLIAAILVVPLFQANGAVISFGVILSSPTFFFFYTLPFAFLLLFYYPFIKRKKINFIGKIFWLMLSVALPLSSPMIPALVLLICPLTLLIVVIDNFPKARTSAFGKRVVSAIQKVPTNMCLYFGLICLISLYSLYIGSFNVENSSSDIPLWERYKLLPEGIHRMYLSQLHFYFIAIPLALNYLLLKRYDNKQVEKLKTYLKWAGVFAILYILLIPLGGFRRYRPLMIRQDIMIPISIILFFLFTWSSYVLLKRLPIKIKYNYIGLTILVLLFFTFSDNANFDKNLCQKEAIIEIVKSDEEVIQIEKDCDILNWGKIKYPESSQYSSRLLKTWQIIDSEKVFVQK